MDDLDTVAVKRQRGIGRGRGGGTSARKGRGGASILGAESVASDDTTADASGSTPSPDATHEAVWVLCESCRKWRELPEGCQVSAGSDARGLPEGI